MILSRSNAFFAGLIAGTIGLALLGATVTPPHFAPGFRRFTVGYNTRWFMATARELKSILDTTPADKIVVVVGGSSVMQGATQAGAMVWTDALQEKLGTRFAVLNLGQRSGASNDTGNFVAEMALKEHRRVIYLCDAMVDHLGVSPNLSPFKLIAFSAWRRGYLLDWPPRNWAMWAALWSRFPDVRLAAWGAFLDLAFNYRDLWNYVTFEWFGTVWNDLDRSGSYTALRYVPDAEPSPEWINANLPQLRVVTPADVGVMQKMLIPPENHHWRRLESKTDIDFPPQLRAVTAVSINLNNPVFLRHLSDEERSQFIVQAGFMASILNRQSFREVLIPELGFSPEDFNDRVHLSVQGGEKLASVMAPHIEDLAKKLGYLR